MLNLLNDLRNLLSFKVDIKDQKAFWDTILKGKPNECWEWDGDLDIISGFGITKRVVSGVKVERYAHRLAYILTFGMVPFENEIRHKCRNRTCCNPQHLIPMRRHPDPDEEAYIAAIYYDSKRLPRLSHFEKMRIRQLRGDGLVLRKIAEHYSVSTSTISRLLKED
tara:strand:- start:5990 stop:6487 length:498 start_codon:yes stop_codon:yes gene_type:complete